MENVGFDAERDFFKTTEYLLSHQDILGDRTSLPCEEWRYSAFFSLYLKSVF